MKAATTMTIEEFAAAYPVYVEAECREGYYEITGKHQEKTSGFLDWLELDPQASVEIHETGLKGWGYDVFAVVSMCDGQGHVAIMAKAA